MEEQQKYKVLDSRFYSTSMGEFGVVLVETQYDGILAYASALDYPTTQERDEQRIAALGIKQKPEVALAYFPQIEYLEQSRKDKTT